ncbi:hypothetical protein BLA29_005954, partial [Euroglyphus maynei]
MAMVNGNNRITNFREILIFIASFMKNCSIGYENELNEYKKKNEILRIDNQAMFHNGSHFSSSNLLLSNNLRCAHLQMAKYKNCLLEVKKECNVLKNHISNMNNFQNKIKNEFSEQLGKLKTYLNITNPIVSAMPAKKKKSYTEALTGADINKIATDHLCIVKSSSPVIKDMNQALNILTEKINHKVLAANKISILNKIKTKEKLLIKCASEHS